MSTKPLAAFSGSLVLVGAGKMGGAMLEGWLAQGLDPAKVVIFDPTPPPEMAARIAELRIAHNPPVDSVTDCAVLLLAVKPQVIRSVIGALPPLVKPGTLVVSVMAGITMATMADYLGQATPIVRSIPNTPAAVGRGITAAVAGGAVTPQAHALAQVLLEATGQVVWVEKEDLIDAATALSGSGPAYVFLMVESLAKAGAAVGLPDDIAMQLARATVEGAGELLFRSPLPPDTLRRNVTSPNGTTQAALNVLMAEDGLDPLMKKAVAAAEHRSRELRG
jgi:pyrroline-5-carboxylate reductase